MHDDGEAAGKGDAGLLEASALGDLYGPCFQGEGLSAPGEDRVGGFVQELAHRSVTLLGDPARPVEFARLMASGHEAEVRAGIARLSEASGIIDSGSKGSGSLQADARYAHQDFAGLGLAGDDAQATIHFLDLLD